MFDCWIPKSGKNKNKHLKHIVQEKSDFSYSFFYTKTMWG